MENKIEQKIKEKLEFFGYKEEDLTHEEMEALREEVKNELDGFIVLDGVLFSKIRYR
jgi:hypothetical protein